MYNLINKLGWDNLRKRVNVISGIREGGVSVIRYIRESLCTFFFLNLGVGRIDPIFSDLCMIWANTYPTKAINE